MFLENINSPVDLKKLNVEECEALAQEIRHCLISSIGENGGHLSSNLGVIELVIAMHYVFDTPNDKFIFDTSHQCYTHKMLTARKRAYMHMQYFKENTGYTNPRESIYDLFEYGHTSTSISLACGMAKLRDLQKERYNVVALIGDASLGGGEAFEGLNFGGTEVNGNLVLIVNDNDMSIAENHGGLYKGLRDLRLSNGQCENNIFKFLGYDYIYQKDGHNIRKLIETFESVKNIDHPIVIHVVTDKGKGYTMAEKYPEETHFVKGLPLKKVDESIFEPPIERYDIIVRDFLLRKMKADPRITFITAAMPVVLSMTKKKRLEAGDQYIDVGIAEACGISVAGGIAKAGGKPVFTTRSTFFQRAYDQISQELCLNNLAVTLLVINASIYSPTDRTHIGIYDIAMMSNIPNLVYLAPTNKQEYLAMLDWSIEQTKYAVAIKVPRNGVHHSKYEVEKDYSNLNKFKKTIKGEKVAIIALGDFYQLGEQVIKLLQKELDIQGSLINPRYITGVDKELLENLKKEHELILTLEDGILEGGFGHKIASFYGSSNIKVVNYGFKKAFFDCYDTEEVMEKNHLTPKQIVADIKFLIRR